MMRRDYKRLCVYPLKSVDRKVMLYPGIGNSYLIIDVDPIVDFSSESVQIPYYPATGDVVRIGDSGQNFLHVASVSEGNVEGYRLRKLRGTPIRWKAQTEISRTELTAIVSKPIHHKIVAGIFFFSP